MWGRPDRELWALAEFIGSWPAIKHCHDPFSAGSRARPLKMVGGNQGLSLQMGEF